MPSLSEGFGLVALEAMAASIPVIASRVTALPEIVIDGETGYLVGPKDVDGLGSSLLKLFSDLPAAGKLGQAGRRRLETEFSVEKMVEQTLEVYDSPPPRIL
jgi:glycosyltransferase involved in cell wall biosynthesis